MADGWSAEVMAWMAETAVCLACGDDLVRDPGVPGAWLSRDSGQPRGVCRARDGYAGGAPHQAARDLRPDGEIAPGVRISAEEAPDA